MGQMAPGKGSGAASSCRIFTETVSLRILTRTKTVPEWAPGKGKSPSWGVLIPPHSKDGKEAKYALTPKNNHKNTLQKL